MHILIMNDMPVTIIRARQAVVLIILSTQELEAFNNSLSSGLPNALQKNRATGVNHSTFKHRI